MEYSRYIVAGGLLGGTLVGCYLFRDQLSSAFGFYVSAAKASRGKLRVPQSLSDGVPPELKPSYFFDLERNFEHTALLEKAPHVFKVLDNLAEYTDNCIRSYPSANWRARESVCGLGGGEVIICSNATVLKPDTLIVDAKVASPEVPTMLLVEVFGGTFDMTCGPVFVGAGAIVEPGCSISGPTYIGSNSHIRSGARIRHSLIGSHVTLGGEVKNSMILDGAHLDHISYCGDSLIGFHAHFGNQATTANLPLMKRKGKNISISVNGTRYDTGRRKMGAVLGDGAQLGCCAVTDPGTLLAPHTHVYPLTRLAQELYGPDEIIKNKPAEASVLERAPFQNRDE